MPALSRRDTLLPGCGIPFARFVSSMRNVLCSEEPGAQKAPVIGSPPEALARVRLWAVSKPLCRERRTPG